MKVCKKKKKKTKANQFGTPHAYRAEKQAKNISIN